MLNIVIESITFNHILHGLPIHIFGGMAIAPEVVAWIVAFAISFPAGFIMSRHIVFPESNLHGRIQLFRYFITTVSFILLTYILIKLFREYLPMINQTVRYTFICVLTAILSYISQRRFTFKSTEVEATPNHSR